MRLLSSHSYPGGANSGSHGLGPPRHLQVTVHARHTSTNLFSCPREYLPTRKLCWLTGSAASPGSETPVTRKKQYLTIFAVVATAIKRTSHNGSHPIYTTGRGISCLTILPRAQLQGGFITSEKVLISHTMRLGSVRLHKDNIG